MAGARVRPAPEDEGALSSQARPVAANESPPLSNRAAALAQQPPRTLFFPFP